MTGLKRVVAILVFCLLVLSSCQSGENQNQTEVDSVDSVDTEEGDASIDETEQDVVDEDEESVADISEPIALIPACEDGYWISPVDGAKLICIPEGSFQMGGLDDDEDAEEDELPLHETEVSQFWIYETEVTNAMFEMFVEATGYTTTAEANGYSYTYADGEWVMMEGADWQHPQGTDSDITGLDDNPVVNVSLSDADAYCLWSNNGYLPTEAQWEKAARGTELNLYPWGDDPVTTELANYTESSDSTTVSVFDLELGSSPFGLLHMSGNVAEWITSVYNADYYETGISYTGDETENQVRGGSWLSAESELRVSDRQPISMEIESADSVGFRCVVSLDYENPAYASAGTDDEIDYSSVICDMIIPADFNAEIITEDKLDKLQEYAYSDQSESSDQNQTLLGFWESEEFKLGIFIPGENNVVTSKKMPCGTLYLYVVPSSGGVANYDEWISFELLDNAVVTTAQDKSTFVFFTSEASAEENEDGSISVYIPSAWCENTATAATVSEETLTGDGVESYAMSTLADGSLELVFFIELGSYPEAFDDWKATLLESSIDLTGMSSTMNMEGDEVVSAYFTINIPAGSTVTQENDILTINITP